MGNRWKTLLMALLFVLAFGNVGYAAGEGATSESAVRSDADTAGELGLLLGDGDGLTEAYLAKSSTRLQAAIISLRLNGRLQEALQYTPQSNFSDIDQVGEDNRAVLGYLQAHPELGWQGPGDGRFDPLAPISAQQFYKVMLEALGYRSGIDFAYADTERYAADKGLTLIAGTTELTNAHIASALAESLSASTAEGQTMLEALQAAGVVHADVSLQGGPRLLLAHDSELGSYFTDEDGKALYFFSKDAEDPNACQGNCLNNWPVFYEEHLTIPAWLSKSDFDVHARADGTKQLTYKGWPLYTFVRDAAEGDVNGEALNNVWFVAKPDYAVMIGTSTELGNYLTDDYGNTLYYFDKDQPGKSACEGQCLVNWPAYAASGAAVPSILTAGDLSSMSRADGSRQSTYLDYPLYSFIRDGGRGDTVGHGVNEVWYVITPGQFQGTTAIASKTYHIDIKDFSFGAEPLTVEAGSTVIFTNYDDMEHNAVAVNGAFSIPLLKKGESATITLPEAGTYDYYCEPHKRFMVGTIIVK